MTTLDEWADELSATLGLDRDETATRTVLDLARVVAHAVDRPAAPLTAFLLGVAVGRGQPLAEAAEQVRVLAEDWEKRA